MLTWKHRALMADENPAPRSRLHCVTTNVPFRMAQARQRPFLGTRHTVGLMVKGHISDAHGVRIDREQRVGGRTAPLERLGVLSRLPTQKDVSDGHFASHLLKETDETWRPFHPRVTAAARSTIHTRAPCVRCGRSTGSGHASFIPPVYTSVSQIWRPVITCNENE